MPAAVIIRRYMGVNCYLVLDDRPREMLRHPGFKEEYSLRPWLGSVDPDDAKEEWAEMLAEDILNYLITDEENREYLQERAQWDHCRMWPEIE